ncbi:MAG: hypothetical protein HUJ96_10395 [Marinilabiliaceae bacterium]|nr:hypothetical protein [Marinilabiliaceae bacterium]
MKTYCNAGDEVSFVITPNSGYELDKIEGVEVADGKFTMPASDVTIYVSFKESETVTAIDAIVAENTGDDELFDLLGRRVNESYRGLVITKSGKKFLKK